MLKSASVSFKDGGLYSLDFNDIYFQPDNAYEEAKYVFIDGNQLEERFQGSEDFSIAEFGFGAGLNFCSTIKLWQSKAKEGWLTYTSFEQSPLDRHQLKSALQLIVPVKDELSVLLEKLPPKVAGCHLLIFPKHRVRLHLVYGEAGSMLSQLNLRADAWFLDGFAPAVNPDLWQESLFNLVAKKSKPGATFATYSVAGSVRRALTTAGFNWEKKKGFGKKRHMLIGELGSKDDRSSSGKKKHVKIGIVGAGLAGLSVAYAFHLRGIQSTIYALSEPCASQNPHALLMPRPAAQNSDHVQITMEGFLFTLNFLKMIGVNFEQRGALYSLRPEERMEKAMRNLNWPRELMDWQNGKLFLPAAATVSLASVRERVIDIVSPIMKLEKVNSINPVERRIKGESYDFIIWAGGTEALTNKVIKPVELQTWQGALLHAPGSFEAVSAQCDGGYILQDKIGRTLGSIFRKDSERVDSCELKQLLEEKAPDFDPIGTSIWQANRAATVDRFPISGPVYQDKKDTMQPEFASFEKYLNFLVPFSGLYQLQGFGSRGLSLAPLLAESLVSRILEQPDPLAGPLVEAVHSARFWYRDVKKGKA